MSGDHQAGNSGQELPQALVVQVLDGSKKRGLPGIPVSFVAVEGGGRFYAGSTVTDLEGYAADYWTPGPKAGEQRAEARAVIGQNGERRVFGEFTAWVVGPPVKLGFSTQPPFWGIAGMPLVPAAQVQVQDELGQHVQGAVTRVLVEVVPADGGLSGTLTRTAIAGTATFDDLVLTKAARRYRLSASAPGLTAATSDTVAIGPAAAVGLAFLVQPPTDFCAGKTIPAPVQVGVVDPFGNTVFASSAPITMGLTPNSAGTGSLTGTLTVAATYGVAVFSDLIVSPHGFGYHLTASADGLTGALSDEFLGLKCAVAP